MTPGPRAAAAGLLALALSGCGGAGSAGSGATAAPALPASQPPLPTVPVQVGAAALVVEVASTDEQRRAGLRGRAVPPGRGMAFTWPSPRTVRFTMAGVTQPLVGVFAAAGRVLSVEQMPPCAGAVADCPSYGPPEPVDVVVEAAPGSLPAVRPGDPLVLGG